MNTTEAIMSSNPHRNPLKVLDLALRAAGTAIALVGKVPGKFKSLENQIIRSASSVAANLAEGAGRMGRDRVHYFRIAYASAKEVDIHLRILLGAGIIDEVKTTEALELFDRVRAMIWRLIHTNR
jgi:four helix bundle protein